MDFGSYFSLNVQIKLLLFRSTLHIVDLLTSTFYKRSYNPT